MTLSPADSEALAHLIARERIRDTVYRYGSTIDSFDRDGIRSVLADDLWAQYGNDDPIIGGDAVAAWISSHDDEIVLQHHLLSVYGIDLHGDTADALVYHTSHQFNRSDLDTATIIVGRYRMQLRCNAGSWRISRLQMEVLWADRRTDSDGLLQSIGGRGPAEVQPRLHR